jgi:hypothetical protein
MAGIAVTLHEYHRTFFYDISLSAALRVRCLSCSVWAQLLQTWRWKQMVPPNKPTNLNGVKKTRRLFYICSTVFAILFRLNKAHNNFSKVIYNCGYWSFLFRLDIMRFVHICVLPQSIPRYVNLYLNITVPLKLRNGTTSHVVFCYAKKIR